MKRCLSALVVLAALALPARAHFLWIVPDQDAAGKPLTAKAIFSDTLEPDTNVPVTKIAKTKLYFRTADGKTTEGKWTEGKHAYTITLPNDKRCLVVGVCHYGVYQRGEEEPVLLNYYAKAVVDAANSQPSDEAEGKNLLQGMEQIPLDITARPGKPGPVVVWKGQPLAGAEVVIVTAPKGKDIKVKADADGVVQLPLADLGPDVTKIGFRVSHTEPKAGKLDGKEYKAVRHYLTLVGTVRKSAVFKKVSPKISPDKEQTKEDPAASKLLAEARAARANWNSFPGFTAELTVNFDGKTYPGTLTVSGTGKVKVDVADDAAREWARRELASLVAHRMDNSSALDTPCTFLDDNAAHPLGRAVRVLNDELHSSYRIRDRQIIEVNRRMKDSRFTITVIENRLNAEKRFLPVSYVVNYWDVGTGALQKSQTHHDAWTRVGSFDLPTSVLVVTATEGRLEARSLTLAGHRLAK
jgi:uncharacterized GH25 family protein